MLINGLPRLACSTFLNMLKSSTVTLEPLSKFQNVKITILKSEVNNELAKQYAIPNFEACPFHKPGQVFISDREHKPDGLCDYAWEPIRAQVKKLSEGKMFQPKGTWMVDDDKGIFNCVDGLRPVIMLIESIKPETDIQR